MNGGRRKLCLAGGLAVAIAAAGCGSPRGAAGEPARLSLLVLRSDEPPGLLANFVDALVERLGSKGLGAAVSVALCCEGCPLAEAAFERADVVVRPAFGSAPDVDSSIDALQATGSMVLWFGTWALGMVLPDREYSFGPNFQLDFEFSPGARPGVPFATRSVRPEPVSMTFFERTGWLSWQLPLTLIVPPSCLRDTDAHTNEVLRDELVESAAGDLAEFLKDEDGFESVALERGPGSMDLAAEWKAGVLRLSGTISSRLPIDPTVVLVANGRAYALGRDADGAARVTQVEADTPGISTVRVEASVPLDKAPGTVRVRARSEIAFSRTLPVAFAP